MKRYLCFFLCLSIFALAEGTYELQKTSTNPIVYLLGPGWNNSSGVILTPVIDRSIPRSCFLRVDILNSNEVIDIYTSNTDNTTNGCDIGIWPAGENPTYISIPPTKVDIASNGNGHIKSFAEVTSAQVITTRPRNPYTYVPTNGSGTYSVRFFGKAGTTGDNSNGIAYWDIMVRDTKGTVTLTDDTLIKGRVWSEMYVFSLNSYTNGIFAVFYVVAGQNNGISYTGYLWIENSNGMKPYRFNMFANQYGADPEKYRSLSTSKAQTDAVMTPKYAIYLNTPSKPVIRPVNPSISSFSFVPTCVNGNPNGGVFTFITNDIWQYEITIDENNDGIYNSSTERTLRGTSGVGINSISWDGKKKDGTAVPIGTNMVIRLRNKGGEVHFPFYDVENVNTNIGPLITISGVGGSNYFWNDLPILGSASPVEGSSTPHTWSSASDTGFGDETIIDTWKFATFVDDIKIFTYGCTGVSVYGKVYYDENHNGMLDAGESSTHQPLYAKIISTTSPTTALQVVPINIGTGEYNFSGVTGGNYRIIVSTNATANDVTPSITSGWVAISPNDLIRTIKVIDSPIVNQNFGLYYGCILTGKVFLDTGIGSGIANNGIQDGMEPGIENVFVRATNDDGTITYDSTLTEGDGSYTIWVPAGGDTIKVWERNMPNYISVSGSFGNTLGIYDRETDSVTFVPIVGASYNNINFGDVLGNIFSVDQQKTAIPGTVVFYNHTFIPGTGGHVSFSLSNVASPNITGWNQVLYQDTNCNTIIDLGEPILSPSTNIQAFVGEKICLILQEYVPSNAPHNARDTVFISTSFRYTNTDPILEKTDLFNIDMTMVDTSKGSLRLIKKVDKTTAKPGEYITYTITYINIGTSFIQEIILSDPMNVNCEFVTGEFEGGKDILWQKPNGDTVYLTATIDSDEGSVENRIMYIRMGSSLQIPGGASGIVQYILKVK